MKNTSFKQKLLLNSFGVILAIALLEITLRIAGALVLFLQERHNHLSFNPNEYRILCLGESTTALGGEDSYPSQLEEMLNAQSRKTKFTVINKGLISTTSDYILAHLEQNLRAYRPQMVIVMMGINDKAYMHDADKALWWESFKSYLKDLRVYKLAHLLCEHISHRIKEINAPAKAADLSPDIGGPSEVETFLKDIIKKCMLSFSQHMSASAKDQKSGQLAQARQEEELARQSAFAASLVFIQLGQRYRIQGHYQDAENVLKQATVLNPNISDLYQEWGELYLAQHKSADAVKAFQAAFAMDPKNNDILLGLARAYHQEHDDRAYIIYAGYLQTKPQDYWGYDELAQWLRGAKHYKMAQIYLTKAIEIGPEFDQAYVDLGQLFDEQGQYQNEEEFYLKEISFHPKGPRLYQSLGQFYQEHGQEDLAKEYFRKGAQQEVSWYYPATLVNYSLLVNKILGHHINVVIMQYPLESIGTLKDYLGQRKGVAFVENRQNFQEALKLKGYGHYFKDNFAYNFGHCTRAGNELIAQNLSGTILNGYQKNGHLLAWDEI